MLVFSMIPFQPLRVASLGHVDRNYGLYGHRCCCFYLTDLRGKDWRLLTLTSGPLLPVTRFPTSPLSPGPRVRLPKGNRSRQGNPGVSCLLHRPESNGGESCTAKHLLHSISKRILGAGYYVEIKEGPLVWWHPALGGRVISVSRSLSRAERGRSPISTPIITPRSSPPAFRLKGWRLNRMAFSVV